MRWIFLLAAGGILMAAFSDEVTPLLRRRMTAARAEYKMYITRRVLIQPAVFVLLGFLMRDLILSLFLFAVAGVVAWYRIRQAKEAIGKISVRHILSFASMFRGEYYLQPAVFHALGETVKRLEPPLKGMARAAVETFYATSSPERAFDQFRQRTDNILLHQFAYILEMGEETSPETMLNVLDAFLHRLRSHEDLERQVETGLANVLSETRFMQSTIYLVIFAVALVPFMRSVWVSSLGWRLVYVIVLTLAVGVSYYVEKELGLLKEQIQ